MENRRRRRSMKSDEDSDDQSYSESASLSEGEGEDDKEPEITSPLSEKCMMNLFNKIILTNPKSEESQGAQKLNFGMKNLESEYESAEEDGNEGPVIGKMVNQSKSSVEEFESPSELIDEEGGEEDTADVEADGEFLEGDTLDLSDDYEEVCVEGERQQGDGEECSTCSVSEEILDYDEDKRNPQYIPKKGTFYEHDDRNNEVVKEKEVDVSREKKKKKLWLDEGKWGHDRYREEEQFPKSKEELIEIYGYDIRNEDGPPRARRRRRYGRGPTKYQRHWEDENAYGKDRPSVNHGFAGGRPRGRLRTYLGNHSRSSLCHKIVPTDHGFTEIKDSVNHVNVHSKHNAVSKEVIEDDVESEEKCFESPVLDGSEFPALPKREEYGLNEMTIEINEKESPVIVAPAEDSVRTQTFENSSLVNNSQIFKEHSSRQGRNLLSRNCFKNTYKRHPNMRSQRGNSRSSFKDENATKVHGSERKNDLMSLVNKGMEKLSFHDKEESEVSRVNIVVEEKNRLFVKNQSSGSKQSNCKPPKQSNSSVPQCSRSGGDTTSRPKRYSSLRQRSLPETQSYHSSQPHLAPGHAAFYDSSYQAMYTGSEVVSPNTQSQASGSPPLINAAYQNFAPSHYPDGYGIRMSVNSAPRLFPQVTLPTGQPVLATQCITPNANVMNFGAPPHPQPAGYAPFTYQQYSTPPPPPPPPGSQPPELYGSGITYYYTQGQPHALRPVPQKRPKAAIPILPPPENEVKFPNMKDQKQLDVCSILPTNPASISDADSVVVLTDAPVQMQPAVEVES